MKKQVKCIHCDEVPGFVKECVSDGRVFWALECNCKSTPYYHSMLSAESQWETVTYKQDSKIALKLVKLEI